MSTKPFAMIRNVWREGSLAREFERQAARMIRQIEEYLRKVAKFEEEHGK